MFGYNGGEGFVKDFNTCIYVQMTENYVIVAVNPYVGKISDEVVKTTTKCTTTSMMGRHLTWVSRQIHL